MNTFVQIATFFCLFAVVYCQYPISGDPGVVYPNVGAGGAGVLVGAGARQAYPQGGVVLPGGVMEVTEVSYVDEPMQSNVIYMQAEAQRPAVKKNIFGLPSVGGGLADIGRTIAHWGSGVLRVAGQVV